MVIYSFENISWRSGIFLAVMGLLVAASCRPSDTAPEDQGLDAPSEQIPSHVYVTGVEFPDGFDWSSGETLHDSPDVSALLFLMVDGKRIAEYPVGQKSGISPEPSRHRCIEGHLYTDYADDAGTVVKKDGQDIFRYADPEDLVSFLKCGEDIYTLGTPVQDGSKGLCLRKNGAVLYSSRYAVLISPLHVDRDTLCFSFCDGDRYYMYSGGDVRGIFPGLSTEPGSEGGGQRYVSPYEVLVAEMVSGELVCVFRMEESGRYAVSRGTETGMIQTYSYNILNACRLLRGRDSLYVYGELNKIGDRLETPRVWTADGKEKLVFGQYKQSFSTIVEGDDIFTFVGNKEVSPSITAYRNAERLWSYGYGLTVTASPAAAVCGQDIYFLFADRWKQKKPYLAVNDEVTQYGFNGYFTSISVW